MRLYVVKFSGFCIILALLAWLEWMGVPMIVRAALGFPLGILVGAKAIDVDRWLFK